MLQIRNLRVRYGYGRDALMAVDGVSIELPPGKTLGLVGESGSGKSTLARAVVGLLPILDGEILLGGEDHSSHKGRTSREWRRRVQMVFQDPDSSLNPRMTIATALGEALATRGVPRQRRRAEALRALELLQLPSSALDRYPHQFSGGQKQRIAIARALAVQPEVVILDEVTSALDVSVQATILNLLNELQRELTLSMLFISHDLSVVGLMSDAVAVMYLGRVVERGASDELFARPQHPYTRSLIRSIPQLEGERISAPLKGDLPDPRNPPRGCRFHTRCPVGPLTHPDRRICMTDDPHADADHRPHDAACHFVPVASTRSEHASATS